MTMMDGVRFDEIYDVDFGGADASDKMFGVTISLCLQSRLCAGADPTTLGWVRFCRVSPEGLEDCCGLFFNFVEPNSTFSKVVLT